MRPERAFLGLSHTPLLELNTVSPDVQADVRSALSTLSEAVTAWQPDRIVLIGPDHYNGFFNELMPPFCLGTAALSVGDYTTPAGPLNVDSAQALGLAEHLLSRDFDMAISRRMTVDHGFAQPLQIVFGSLDTPPVVPIFLNAVAPPSIPTVARCAALGQTIGEWLDSLAGRTLVIGSGGLSHEPPVPTLDHPDQAIRERITRRNTPTAAEREAKTRRVMAAGVALAAGDPSIRPLAPQWDAQWMQAIESGRFDDLVLGEASMTRIAGRSAHESKTWVVGRAALAKDQPTIRQQRWYRAIPEFIAGFGILLLTQTFGRL